MVEAIDNGVISGNKASGGESTLHIMGQDLDRFGKPANYTFNRKFAVCVASKSCTLA